MLVPIEDAGAVSRRVIEINAEKIGMTSITRGEWKIEDEFQYAATLYDDLYDPALGNSLSDLELAFAVNVTPKSSPWLRHYDIELQYRKVPLTQYCIFEARRWASNMGYTPDNQIVPCHGSWSLRGIDVWMNTNAAERAIKTKGLRDSFCRSCAGVDQWLMACTENKYLCPFIKLTDNLCSGSSNERNMLICAWGLTLLGYHTPVRDIVNDGGAYDDNIVASNLYAFLRDYKLAGIVRDTTVPSITAEHAAQVVRAVKKKFSDKGGVFDGK